MGMAYASISTLQVKTQNRFSGQVFGFRMAKVRRRVPSDDCDETNFEYRALLGPLNCSLEIGRAHV